MKIETGHVNMQFPMKEGIVYLKLWQSGFFFKCNPKWWNVFTGILFIRYGIL